MNTRTEYFCLGGGASPSTRQALQMPAGKRGAAGQLSGAESPLLPAPAKGTNPIQCPAVSLARSTGNQVSMHVRLLGLPEAGAADATVVARRVAPKPAKSAAQARSQVIRRLTLFRCFFISSL